MTGSELPADGSLPDVDAEVAAQRERLQGLHEGILRAELTLRDLQSELGAAREAADRVGVQAERAEIRRLIEQNQLIAEDAASARAALAEALKASHTDALTGLGNREILMDRLLHDLQLARRNGTGLAVFFLDVDHFKLINDQWGHAVGDLALQRIAQVLRSTVRASDSVCRVGGDEFVIVASACQTLDAEEIVGKVHAALATPLSVDGHCISLRVSIGYAMFPEQAQSTDALLKRADEAMYACKRAGRSG